jgi:hypothetical protein
LSPADGRALASTASAMAAKERNGLRSAFHERSLRASYSGGTHAFTLALAIKPVVRIPAGHGYPSTHEYPAAVQG